MVEVPVLIVGGGPVGLSSATLLASHGVPSLLVERHPATTDHPKARGLNIRTMELFRQWGVEEAVRTHSLPPEAWRFIWCTTVAGEEIGRVEDPDDAVLTKSPTSRCLVAQDAVESELRAFAEAKPLVDLRFSTEFRSFVQDDSGVTGTIADLKGDSEDTVRAKYVIAADGAASRVRQALGIDMEGPAALAHMLNIHFRADLTPWFAHRPCVGFFFAARELVGGSILSVNGTDRWLSLFRYDPEAGDTPEDFTTGRCIEIVRGGVGVPVLNVEVINTLPWTMTAQVAKRFREGRVFLAGDAAHRFPPTGGFGMNNGIQDVHNLAWKLAAVLNGCALPGLLDTYDDERRPVAQSNTSWSVNNAVRMGAIYSAIQSQDHAEMKAQIEDQKDHIAAEGQDLGFWYESAAVIPDGSEAPRTVPSEYLPTSRPGSRAPHAWLEQEGRPVSTLDLFDRGFTLLAGPAGQTWRDAGRAVAHSANIPLEAYCVGSGRDLADPGGEWLTTYDIDDDGAVLVRPDGHVAWRSRTRATEPRGTLDSVMGTVLCR